MRGINGLSEALSIALLFESEGRGTDEFWNQVQGRHLEVLRFANEAPIYGTAKGVIAAYAARACAQEGALVSNIYEPRTLKDEERTQALFALQNYPATIDEAALGIAAEARRHLQLDRLPPKRP